MKNKLILYPAFAAAAAFIYVLAIFFKSSVADYAVFSLGVLILFGVKLMPRGGFNIFLVFAWLATAALAFPLKAISPAALLLCCIWYLALYVFSIPFGTAELNLKGREQEILNKKKNLEDIKRESVARRKRG